MTSKIPEKLKDPEYRKAFVASQINIGIPFQIRGLLKSKPGWTQQTLVEKTGMLQPRISGLMTPGKTRPNIETLRRIAEAFDCGLMVRFVPFSELAQWSENFDPETFHISSFADDAGFIERYPPSGESSGWAALQATGTDSKRPTFSTGQKVVPISAAVETSSYSATGSMAALNQGV